MLLRFGAPALAALALVMVVAGESRDVDHDLQLIVPASVPPGGSMPVRALAYTGFDDVEGPRLSPRDVALELRDGDRVLAKTHLRSSRSGTNDVEGTLVVPAGANGKLRVRATLRVGRDEVVVSAPVLITKSARGEPAEGRPLRLLQQFSESGVQRLPFGGQPPPAAFETRVAGGACVPEEPCAIYVHVGEPASAIQVEQPNAAVTQQAPAADATIPETTGVLGFVLVTHGPEAELWLRATRGARAAGRRQVRLPIAQGASTLHVETALLDAGAKPKLSLLGDGEGCIVDAHRFGEDAAWHWTRTGSLADCSAPIDAPWPGLEPGIHRLQARRDPFATTTAGVSLVYVRAPGESARAALLALARAASKIDPYDKLVAQLVAQPDASGAELGAAYGYVAAVLESGLVAQPRAATGYAEAREKLSATRARLRWLAILALVIGGVSLALGVGKRGLVASERASQIMLEAGQDAATSERDRMRGTLAVIGSVLALLLVFAVVALYLLARGSSPL